VQEVLRVCPVRAPHVLVRVRAWHGCVMVGRHIRRQRAAGCGRHLCCGIAPAMCHGTGVRGLLPARCNSRGCPFSCNAGFDPWLCCYHPLMCALDVVYMCTACNATLQQDCTWQLLLSLCGMPELLSHQAVFCALS
jgi:hypothetical protein